jgi:hypothetical protein
MGKHIDKLPCDAPSGTRTLPVLLGEGPAKVVTVAMMVAHYVGVVALVIAGELPWPALLTTRRAAHAGVVRSAVRRAPAHRCAAEQPGVAAVVGADRIHPHAPRRRAAHPRAAGLAGLDLGPLRPAMSGTLLLRRLP